MATEPKKRRIDDAGEKIHGARKDWKVAHMTATDVEGMTDEEIVENVKKDNIWPKPDYEALVTAGMEPIVAAGIKIVRDRMAQEPALDRRYTTIELRKAFVDMTSMIRDVAMKSTSITDLGSLYRDVEAELGSFKSPENKIRYGSVFKGRTCPFFVTKSDMYKALGMVKQGFPAKQPAWKIGVKVVPYGGAYAVVQKGKLVHKDAASAEDAWKWAEEALPAQKAAAKKSKPKEPTRPHLDYLSRSGMSFSLDGHDVTPEDFIETFGFRGVQFGNWLPDSERQKVLNMGYEAMIDIADILGVEPRAMSLDGSLAIAFGARGTGKAAAHYESGQRVVNMTRINGAGSLAHEYAHALDHWIGTGASSSPTGGIPSASGWRHLIDTDERKRILSHRHDETLASWEKLMSTILKKPITADMRISRLEDRVTKIQEQLQKNAENIAKSVNPTFIRQATEWARENEGRIVTITNLIEETKAADLDKTYGQDDTDYVKQAVQISGTGDYWKRPNELFARAFESWVFDEIEARHAKSEYLVHGVEPDRYETGYKGNPYPCGDERSLINEAMREMAKAMKPEMEASLDQTSHLHP